ncbi:hypothetical protein EII17_01370 [Clostridiales bacterium COT073_COT-073]|nr:hypothetical protein EII17_01370 [Clostridiales bacterium COT073_COT-073]
MKNLRVEFAKMKRKRIGMIGFFLLGLELAWSTLPVRNLLAEVVDNADYPAWESVVMFILTLKALIFPILIAVIVSRLNDMEHKGNTWKLLQSMGQGKERIWHAKFMAAFLLISIFQVLEAIYVLGFGNYLGIRTEVPVAMFFKYFVGATVINMALILVQQWLSMRFENQVIAMSVGMLGGFSGIISAFLPAFVRNLLIWGYYINLTPAAFDATGVIQRREIGIWSIVIALIAAALIYAVGYKQMKETEI